MKITRQLRIRGRVQGVGFRDALRRTAIAQGCTGWVRNRLDGSVEALVQGHGPAVQALIAWARRGPPAARVSEVEVLEAQAEYDLGYVEFDFLPTT